MNLEKPDDWCVGLSSLSYIIVCRMILCSSVPFRLEGKDAFIYRMRHEDEVRIENCRMKETREEKSRRKQTRR